MISMSLKICILSVVTAMLHAATSKWCFDSRCTCRRIKHTDYYRAYCSQENLQNIPRLPRNIKSIDLSFNSIKMIPDNTFVRNSELEELNMSYNHINSLYKDSFQGLTNLLNLTLNNNNILNVSKEVFLHLNKLKYLDLKNNDLDLSRIDFSLLRSLKHLHLDLTINQSLPSGLSRLTKLDTSGITGKCEIKRLTSTTFKTFPALKSIDISACKINYIYKGTFKDMRNLYFLDVSLNRCLGFTGFENITFDLLNTEIKIFKANRLYNTEHLNTELKISHVRNLKLTNLTELHLDGNRIQLIQKGALQMIPRSIRFVSASDNYFSFGNYVMDVIGLPVEVVNASYLFTTHILELQEICDDQDNQDCAIQQNHAKYVSTYQKSQSPLYETNLPVADSLNPVFPLPKHLKRLILKQCKLRYEIQAYDVAENNTLEYVDVSFNTLYSWIGPILYLNKLKFLSLSDNICSNVSNVFFKGTPNLEILYMHNNLLGFVLPKDVNGKIMQHVPKLRKINLSSNKIPTLPFHFFKYQAALRKLYMRGNMLDSITFRINHMKNLTHLDLSYNRFSSLDKASRNQIDIKMQRNQRFTIDLSDNPLQCTCDTIEFIQWMTTTAAKFHKLSSYYCKLSNGKKQTLSNPQSVLEILQKQCSSYIGLIIGTTTGSLLFISILISAIIYRNRWKLRYMYYMTKNKYQTHTRDSERDPIEYRYNAFISYEDNDRFFVHDQLMKKLENEFGLKLCIHKRDFLPGTDIADNITAAIHGSRKMVVILSSTYLDSYWCIFEYNMARLESIYSRNKKNIMFLVFLEQIPSQKLPLIVLELIQNQSYIEFPNDEYGDTVFWDKLKEVLTQ